MEPTGWMDGSTDLCEQTHIPGVHSASQLDSWMFSPLVLSLKQPFFQMGLMVSVFTTTFGR